PAEIFNGRNRRGRLRKINPFGYRHDRAALGNLRNMTTARQRRLWPPAPCPAPPSPSPAVDARPRRRVSPPRSCFLLTWPSPQPTAVSWRVFRTSPDGYTRSHTGTFTVAGRTLTPSNRTIDETETIMSRVANGKIVESWATWDRLSLLERLGAIAKPA